MTGVSVGVDTTQVRLLAEALGSVPGKAVPLVVEAVRGSGDDLRDKWQANARVTAGSHGRLYPDSITAEMRYSAGFTSSIGAEVGPDASRPQGSMGRGFEYGSVNQPPHLDGTKASDLVAPVFTARLSTALAKALGSL